MNVVAKDGAKFLLTEKMYRQSILLRNISDCVAVPEEGVKVLVDSDVFSKITEFMIGHENDPEIHEEYDTFDIIINDFDRAFVEVERDLLFRITAAANYLNMPFLLELCCKVIAEALREKTTEEIREYLSFQEGVAIEEEESARKEYDWIQDKK